MSMFQSMIVGDPKVGKTSLVTRSGPHWLVAFSPRCRGKYAQKTVTISNTKHVIAVNITSIHWSQLIDQARIFPEVRIKTFCTTFSIILHFFKEESRKIPESLYL